MPTPRHSFGFAWLPATYNVYAIGGMLGWQDAVTATERYDACSRSWTTMAPLPQPRGYVQAAELNGKLYVVGGVDRVISGTYQVHNETWVYDPIGNAWSQAANYPQALGGVALAVVNSRLYAFGGFDARGPNGGDVASTYVYNPDNNTWLARADIISGTRSLAGAARLNDKIYLVGGTSSTGSMASTAVNVYNPATNSWSNAAPLIDGVHSPGVAVLPDANLLYVVGGGIQWYSLVGAQVYDPAANTWSYLDDIYSDYSPRGRRPRRMSPAACCWPAAPIKVYGLNDQQGRRLSPARRFLQLDGQHRSVRDSTGHAPRLHDRTAQRHRVAECRAGDQHHSGGHLVRRLHRQCQRRDLRQRLAASEVEGPDHLAQSADPFQLLGVCAAGRLARRPDDHEHGDLRRRPRAYASPDRLSRRSRRSIFRLRPRRSIGRRPPAAMC